MIRNFNSKFSILLIGIFANIFFIINVKASEPIVVLNYSSNFNDEIGMNKDQYLRMIEQTGEEIDWKRIPPDIEDFPPMVHRAITIYNNLGDRVYSDVGFTGKDYTNLKFINT